MTAPGNASFISRQAVIAAGPAATGAAIAFARDFAAATGCPPTLAGRLAIIIEELVINLHEHGALPPGAPITIGLSAAADSITVELSDPGPAFDPRHAPAPVGLPPERGGGAGLALVNAWSTIEVYDSHPGGNHLRLRLLPADAA